ncbi:MAG: hypothetical protein E7Z95_04990 [Actinomyces succiniciruminis]|nr:hypothetical protein [Actinomyces succiniciruminis]
MIPITIRIGSPDTFERPFQLFAIRAHDCTQGRIRPSFSDHQLAVEHIYTRMPPKKQHERIPIAATILGRIKHLAIMG